jgi:hypothetical protein
MALAWVAKATRLLLPLLLAVNYITADQAAKDAITVLNAASDPVPTIAVISSHPLSSWTTECFSVTHTVSASSINPNVPTSSGVRSNILTDASPTPVVVIRTKVLADITTLLTVTIGGPGFAQETATLFGTADGGNVAQVASVSNGSASKDGVEWYNSFPASKSRNETILQV